MRLIMFGTGPFAVPTFESLLDSNHEILALVTRPIADSGKRRKTAENPTRDVAEKNDLLIFDPLNVNDESSIAKLVELKADLFVVCDYGQILSRECLAAASGGGINRGGINLHGSLLPQYRGAAPINWAIFNGDTTTGITIIHMTSRLDGGPCLSQAETAIGPRETAEQIEPRLAQLGVAPVLDAIAQLETWDGKSDIGERQDPELATRAPRLKKSDGLIDWTRSAVQIFNQIRAFQPWPGSFTLWNSTRLKQPMRLIVHQVSLVDTPDSEIAIDATPGARPGQVVVSQQHQLIVQTGNGRLSIETLQPAGKRPMPVEDFLRGNAPEVGETLG